MIGLGLGVGIGVGVGAGLVGGALVRGCIMKKMLGCLLGGGKKPGCGEPCHQHSRPSGGHCSISAGCCERNASFGFGMSVKMGC